MQPVLEVDGMPSDKFLRVERYLELLRTRPGYHAISPRTKGADAAALMQVV
jgi:hypothetical protein